MFPTPLNRRLSPYSRVSWIQVGDELAPLTTHLHVTSFPSLPCTRIQDTAITLSGFGYTVFTLNIQVWVNAGPSHWCAITAPYIQLFLSFILSLITISPPLFFKIFFYVDHFKVCTEYVTVLLLFYVLVFLLKSMWILGPWPGIKPEPPALEGKVLTTGPAGKPFFMYLNFSFYPYPILNLPIETISPLWPSPAFSSFHLSVMHGLFNILLLTLVLVKFSMPLKL